MRIAAFALLIASIASIASARECELGGSVSMSGGFVADRAFYQCILAEIRALKKKQAELERIVRQYEQLMAEMPAHYTNENGEVDFEEGRKIGSASFILSSRQLGGPNSIELDRQVLESVCASPKGCSATLTYRRFGFRGDDALEIQKVGPCEFEIEGSSGCWICGPGCGSEVSITGIDGDGSVMVTGSGASVIMEAGPGCILSDANTKRLVGTGDDVFEADYRPGLFLIADPTRREDGATRFECDLEIE